MSKVYLAVRSGEEDTVVRYFNSLDLDNLEYLGDVAFNVPGAGYGGYTDSKALVLDMEHEYAVENLEVGDTETFDVYEVSVDIRLENTGTTITCVGPDPDPENELISTAKPCCGPKTLQFVVAGSFEYQVECVLCGSRGPRGYNQTRAVSGWNFTR